MSLCEAVRKGMKRTETTKKSHVEFTKPGTQHLKTGKEGKKVRTMSSEESKYGVLPLGMIER
jgi:hypothetical protein